MKVEAEFKTEDGTRFRVDTKVGTWVLTAGVGEGAVTKKGSLTPLGLGSFSLEPRTPKTEGPGAGLCVISIYAIIDGDTLLILARGNQPIKDFALMEPIVSQLYQVVP